VTGPAEQPVPFDDSVALAERLGATRMDLTVRSVRPLTPLLVRVELAGEALRDLRYEPGQDLMLTADAGPPMVRRRWTIRSHDRLAGTVALDVVVHPGVAGASALHAASPGDVVEAIGPRGKVHLVPAARVHHFLGDQSFLPAAFAMAEAVAAPARAVVTMTVPTREEQQPLDAPEADAVRWVAEQADDAGTGLALLEASGLGEPEDGVVVYVGGEMTLASTIRSALVRDRGWPREAVLPKPYWRRGTPNARNGEPGRE
jgi:NADPH-dependent ferric siderophore reductase